MPTYIYACLCKPIDPDELIYWVKSIFCNADNFRKWVLRKTNGMPFVNVEIAIIKEEDTRRGSNE